MIASCPWQSLGAYLREARHRTAYTQHHIARHLGITQPAYSQIERGQFRPRPALLVPLVLLLGLSLVQVVTLAGYPMDEVIDAITQVEREKTGGATPSKTG